MSASINLEAYFNVESLIKVFEELEESKRDKFTGYVNIPMGADGITYQDFKKNLDRNVKEISRRVLSGKYQFYPLREVKVPKDINDPSRGERPLRIARIRDMLVQKQLYKSLTKVTERRFGQAQYDEVSIAYRKNKSAHTAIRGIWWYFQQDGFEWALDADIKGFFDELNHKRMLDLIDDLVGKDSITGKMLWRYTRTLYVPYEEYKHLSYQEREIFFMKNKPPIPDSVQDAEKKGIPQGGVLSGMLANLYLYEFDKWVVDELKPLYDVRYFRYADDFVILAKSKDTVDKIAPMVKQKLSELHLEMHPIGGQKTKIVHIPTDSLEFLGFSINAEHIKVGQKKY